MVELDAAKDSYVAPIYYVEGKDDEDASYMVAGKLNLKVTENYNTLKLHSTCIIDDKVQLSVPRNEDLPAEERLRDIEQQIHSFPHCPRAGGEIPPKFFKTSEHWKRINGWKLERSAQWFMNSNPLQQEVTVNRVWSEVREEITMENTTESAAKKIWSGET